MARTGEFHPQALTDPDVTVSHHPALIIPLPSLATLPYLLAPIEHILQTLFHMELAVKEHFEHAPQVAPEPQAEGPPEFLYVSYALPRLL
jgi:hypothetical protein